MLGCNNLLQGTDHKPLVGVFAKNLEDIEKPRLLSIAEKTMWFKFTTIHVPGKLNNGPDFMSRHSWKHSATSQENVSLASQCIEVGRVSTYGLQIDGQDEHVMYHSRVVVPVCLQEEVLEGLYAVFLRKLIIFTDGGT